MWNKKIVCALIVISLVGCSGIPRQDLENYVTNFNSAKSTTQDIILIVKLIAESESEQSNEGAVALEEKINALDARLDALDLISNYNDILVSLASGTDPEAVYGSLQNLGNGLSSFGSKSISSLVENAMPYGELISQAVALIDNAIKAEQFKDAVNAAHKPIQGIIDILIQDSDDLFEIQEQSLSKRQDPERDKIIDLRFSFQELINSYSAEENIESLISEFNENLILMNVPSEELPDQVEYLSGGTNNPDVADINTLKLLVNQLSVHIQNYNKIVEQLEAIADVKLQYQNLLQVTSESFENLNFAIQHEQYFLPIDLTIDVLNLRKAYLKLQEAKQR